jgi:hypothetical protein
MELLWDDDLVTARQIRERLYADQKNQHGTVQRLLQRLEEKGYVARNDDLPARSRRSAHSCVASGRQDGSAGGRSAEPGDRFCSPSSRDDGVPKRSRRSERPASRAASWRTPAATD